MGGADGGHRQAAHPLSVARHECRPVVTLPLLSPVVTRRPVSLQLGTRTSASEGYPRLLGVPPPPRPLSRKAPGHWQKGDGRSTLVEEPRRNAVLLALAVVKINPVLV